MFFFFFFPFRVGGINRLRMREFLFKISQTSYLIYSLSLSLSLCLSVVEILKRLYILLEREFPDISKQKKKSDDDDNDNDVDDVDDEKLIIDFLLIIIF